MLNSFKKKSGGQDEKKFVSKNGRTLKQEAEFAEVGIVTRGEYETFKRRALRFEPQNFRYILMIPCSGDQGWCEIGDHSALLYKYFVCEKIGTNVSLMDDFDSYYNEFEIGRIRTRGFDLVRTRVKNAGLYKSEILKERCLIIELSKKVSIETLNHLKDIELKRQDELNQIVPTRPVDPVLYQKLIEVATRLHRLGLRSLDRLSSETNGIRMVETMDGMLKKYHVFSDKITGMTDGEVIAKWYELREDIQSILVELQIIAGLRLWKRDVCMGLGESLVSIKQRIEQKIARVELNAKKKEEKENSVKNEKENKHADAKVVGKG